MKSKTMWINFITHNRKRSWKWKPWFIKSQIIYGRGGDTWLAPHWELGWGPFVFQWTGYSHEKKHKPSEFAEHECAAELLQERINALENAIRKHRKYMKSFNVARHDAELWKVLSE